MAASRALPDAGDEVLQLAVLHAADDLADDVAARVDEIGLGHLDGSPRRGDGPTRVGDHGPVASTLGEELAHGSGIVPTEDDADDSGIAGARMRLGEAHQIFVL